MSACNQAIRFTWLGFAILLLLPSLAFFGAVCYNLSTIDNSSEFIYGTFTFSYMAMFFTGALIATCIVSFVAIAMMNLRAIYVVVACWAVIMFAHVMFYILVGALNKMPTIMEALWDETSDLIHDVVQYFLTCCGYHGSSEYATVPDSCKDDGGATHTLTCEDAIFDRLAERQTKLIWVVCLLIFHMIEITNIGLPIALWLRMSKVPTGEDDLKPPPYKNINKVHPKAGNIDKPHNKWAANPNRSIKPLKDSESRGPWSKVREGINGI